MNGKGCEYRTRLADYADYAEGGPGEREHRELQAHLAECADCRRALGELRWVEALLSASLREAPVESLPTLPARNIGSRRVGWLRPALAAAAVLAALVAWGVFHVRRSEPRAPNERSVAAKNAAGPQSPRSNTSNDRLQWSDVEAAIEREASAARLAASAEVLAAEAGADEYARRSWRLLAETFPETRAGRDAARRATPGAGY